MYIRGGAPNQIQAMRYKSSEQRKQDNPGDRLGTQRNVKEVPGSGYRIA